MAAGAGIAAADNLAFGGEISPVVILALLLAATVTAGFVGGGRGAGAAMTSWAWVPGVHLVKWALGLPDTLHPSTLGSIGKMAAVTLTVAAAGCMGGVAARRRLVRPDRRPLRPG
jgi:hypothetical protein